MPQAFIEISTALLTEIVRGVAPLRMPCPTADPLFTDLAVDDVVPLRGDDQAADLILDQLASDIGLSRFDTLPITFGPDRSKPQQASLVIASTFLVVRGSIRTFNEALLEQAGTSDGVTPTSF